jgi:cytochrome c oxidase cbb3-type subunit 4
MDINDLRSIMTVVSFVTFMGIVWWAWSRHSKAGFEEAARLVFDDEDDIAAPNAETAERR